MEYVIFGYLTLLIIAAVSTVSAFGAWTVKNLIFKKHSGLAALLEAAIFHVILLVNYYLYSNFNEVFIFSKPALIWILEIIGVYLLSATFLNLYFIDSEQDLPRSSFARLGQCTKALLLSLPFILIWTFCAALVLWKLWN
jgi:hypothetical protein